MVSWEVLKPYSGPFVKKVWQMLIRMGLYKDRLLFGFKIQ